MKAKEYADRIIKTFRTHTEEEYAANPQLWPSVIIKMVDMVVMESRSAVITRRTREPLETVLWREAWLKWKKICQLVKVPHIANQEVFITYLKSSSWDLFFTCSYQGCLVGYDFSEQDKQLLRAHYDNHRKALGPAGDQTAWDELLVPPESKDIATNKVAVALAQNLAMEDAVLFGGKGEVREALQGVSDLPKVKEQA